MARRVVRPTPTRSVVVHPGLEPIGLATTIGAAGLMRLNLTAATGTVYRATDYRRRATAVFGPLQDFGHAISAPQKTNGRRSTPQTALPATSQPLTTRSQIMQALAAQEGFD
jgi:hypothetical protein